MKRGEDQFHGAFGPLAVCNRRSRHGLIDAFCAAARQAGFDENPEVLLAAGAYGCPQLLMLSGIGPADDLKMLQIEVRENLPVGHNLQDHPVAGITLFTDAETLMSRFEAGEHRPAAKGRARAAHLECG